MTIPEVTRTFLRLGLLNPRIIFQVKENPAMGPHYHLDIRATFPSPTSATGRRGAQLSQCVACLSVDAGFPLEDWISSLLLQAIREFSLLIP
jgi:hypothetical protein